MPRYRRNRRFTRKKLLNITSEKKRDKMLTWTNTTAANPVGSTTYASTPAILKGASGLNVYCFPFCATARDNTIGTDATTGRAGNKYDTSTRTSSSPYMVGLKENIEIQVPDGMPWQWRRICFTYKGGETMAGALPASNQGYAPAREISVGWVRILNSLGAVDQATFFGVIFQGVNIVDWADPMTAKLDNERITVKYDKTCTIASGNEEGVIRQYKKWHGMRKTLQYYDDEQGGTVIPSFFSTLGNSGMGDYWVVDLFKPRMGASASNNLSFNCESTLYWHER